MLPLYLIVVEKNVYDVADMTINAGSVAVDNSGDVAEMATDEMLDMTDSDSNIKLRKDIGEQ